MADSCPSCGAPITGSASTCPFCGSPIRSSSASNQQAQPPQVQRPVEPEEEIEVTQQQPQRNISREEMMDPVSQQQGFPGDMPQQAGGGRSRMMKIIILIGIIVIAFFMFRGCGSDKGKDKVAPKADASAVQPANTNNAPAPSGSISVSTGLDGNQTASVDTSNASSFYAAMKQQAAVANKRYAAAWRMIPADIRGELQQSISALPKRIDSKCKNLAKQYMSSDDDMERRGIYLKCSMDHENVVSAGIERFARDYRNGSAGNFLSYTNPQELLDRNWVFKH